MTGPDRSTTTNLAMTKQAQSFRIWWGVLGYFFFCHLTELLRRMGAHQQMGYCSRLSLRRDELGHLDVDGALESYLSYCSCTALERSRISVAYLDYRPLLLTQSSIHAFHKPAQIHNKEFTAAICHNAGKRFKQQTINFFDANREHACSSRWIKCR